MFFALFCKRRDFHHFQTRLSVCHKTWVDGIMDIEAIKADISLMRSGILPNCEM